MAWPGKPADHRETIDVNLLRNLMLEYLTVRKYFLGDFYPLTDYSLNPQTWLAWQFDRPDLGGGIVQAFRRSESLFVSAQFKLRGLDPNAAYEITDLDIGQPREVQGRELVQEGIVVTVNDKPGAVIFQYKKVQG